MPERPDLEYAIPILAQSLTGARIAGLRVKKPVVLRVAVPGDPAETLTGRVIAGVSRRGASVVFSLDDAGGRDAIDLVIAPMLAGRFSIDTPETRSPGDLAVAWPLADGRELRYRDDVQMGKVYVIPRGAWEKVPGFARVGVDVLDRRAFTRAAFREIARGRREQVKVFIMDKEALDGLGNAYADEVLFQARLHPKTRVGSLSGPALDKLHDSIVSVLTAARKEIARRKPPLDAKVRDFLKVRNRHGEACPRCGAKIRRAGVHGHDAFFCPVCQPSTVKGAIDWNDIEKPG